MNSDEELTKEIGKLLELARKNPAFKMRSLKSQATKAIHTYIEDRDTKRDAYVIGKSRDASAYHDGDLSNPVTARQVAINIENGLMLEQRQRAKEWSDK